MNWFYNLNISKKLLLTFSTIIFIVSAICVFSIVELSQVNKASSDISVNWLPSIKAIGDVKLSLSRLKSAGLHHVVTKDEKEMNNLSQYNEEKMKIVNEANKTYQSLISEPEERKIYSKLQPIEEKFFKQHEEIIALSQKGEKEAALTLANGDYTKNYNTMLEQLDKLSEINQKGAVKSNQLADETFKNAQLWITGLLITCIILSIIMGIWVSRLIANPLTKAVAIANKVAQGDLTAEIQSTTKDETGQLMLALQTMNENLRTIVSEVRSGTDNIATASAQISNRNLDLSSRTEQQASSLEETASAIEELTATVQQNAQNTVNAKEMSLNASQLANNSGKIVNELIHTMGSIKDSSKKIVDIIAVIDNIAFQTNILSLNQQNAALVEEAAAASVSLEEQAQKLANAVSVFKV